MVIDRPKTLCKGCGEAKSAMPNSDSPAKSTNSPGITDHLFRLAKEIIPRENRISNKPTSRLNSCHVNLRGDPSCPISLTVWEMKL